MTTDLAVFWIHDVTVERLTGSGAYGLTYATAETVTGFVADGQRLVVNAAGEQVTSTATVYLPAGAVAVPVQSKVTLPATFADRVTEVVTVVRRDSGALGLPDHVELSLL